MKRPPQARPLTRQEAERLGLYLAPRQPRKARRRAQWADLDPATQVIVLAFPLAVLVGILAVLVLGDQVWVPTPS